MPLTNLPVTPSWLFAPKAEKAKAEPNWLTKALRGVGEGERNATCTRLAGYFRNVHPQDITLALMLEWGSKCSPPMPKREVETVVKSVYQYKEPMECETPEVSDTASGFLFRWPDVKIEISRLREHRDGRTTGEVLIHTLGPSGNTHLHQAQLNLSSSRARTDLAKLLQLKYKTAWEPMLEILCTDTLSRMRTGEPLDILKTEDVIEQPKFLLHPLLIENQPTILFGQPGSGKSLTALASAMFLVLYPDKNPLGWEAYPDIVRSIYLDWETNRQEVAWRMKCLARTLATGNDGESLPCEIPYRRCALPLADDINAIKQIVSDANAKLVIIDSLGAACGGDLTTAEPALRFFSALRQLKTTSLILAHTSKDEMGRKTPYGTIFFQVYSRSIWEVRGQTENDELTIALIHRKSNVSRLFPALGFKAVFSNGRVDLSRTSIEDLPEVQATLPLSFRIKALLAHGKLTTKDIAEELGTPMEQVRARLTELKKKRLVANFSGEWGLTASADH